MTHRLLFCLHLFNSGKGKGRLDLKEGKKIGRIGSGTPGGAHISAAA